MTIFISRENNLVNLLKKNNALAEDLEEYNEAVEWWLRIYIIDEKGDTQDPEEEWEQAEEQLQTPFLYSSRFLPRFASENRCMRPTNDLLGKSG